MSRDDCRKTALPWAAADGEGAAPPWAAADIDIAKRVLIVDGVRRRLTTTTFEMFKLLLAADGEWLTSRALRHSLYGHRYKPPVNDPTPAQLARLALTLAGSRFELQRGPFGQRIVAGPPPAATAQSRGQR